MLITTLSAGDSASHCHQEGRRKGTATLPAAWRCFLFICSPMIGTRLASFFPSFSSKPQRSTASPISLIRSVESYKIEYCACTHRCDPPMAVGFPFSVIHRTSLALISLLIGLGICVLGSEEPYRAVRRTLSEQFPGKCHAPQIFGWCGLLA